MASDMDIRRIAQAAAAALARRDFAAALTLGRQWIGLRPFDVGANQIVGLAALETGELATATAHLQRASASAPNNADLCNVLGVALKRCGEVDRARAAFKRAGELGAGEAWRNLGNLESEAGAVDAAIAAYRAALRANESDAAAHASLAQMLERRHALEEARAHAVRALSLDAGSDLARLALAQLALREKNFAEAEATALPLAVGGASKTNRALAWGIVGEARDRLDRPHAAFSAFRNANALLSELHGRLLSDSHLPHHPDGVRRMLAMLDAPTPLPPSRFQTPAPIFLVGFPRSGTTLLDQILSSHSRLYCMEEREVFAESVADLAAADAPPADLDIEKRRSTYWARVTEPLGGRLLVDKLPLNIVFLPLIARVFPDAKIILALRDPRDAVLSCFQQRFGMNAAMAQFLDLPNAASYYDLMMSLMEACRARLTLAVHQVRYEDVVADLEREARALASFLELPFEPGMLGFRETAIKRDINTPSARQVIEPLYNRSIGRWRRYEADLAPVLPNLTEWALRYGYEA
ncbi:MAG: sulfotransferase [Proteobacteria bacterium]|nr:sulfotransferase [Pseudomonadota bacterium]